MGNLSVLQRTFFLRRFGLHTAARSLIGALSNFCFHLWSSYEPSNFPA